MKSDSLPLFQASTPAPRGWPLLRLGFRPFYIGGALLAALAVPLWVAMFLGQLAWQPQVPPLLWHVHEMLCGFAVVAGEVRTLSQRVAAAASEIKQLVNDSEIKIATGNKLVNDAGETMHEIASSIRSVIGIVSEFSSASSSIQHEFRSKVDDAVVDLVQAKQRRLA